MKRKPLPENQRVFTFTSASELLASKQSVPVVVPVKGHPKTQVEVLPVVAPVAVSSVSVDPGICEFAGDYAFPGASGRLCTDKTFCPSRIYGAAAVYEKCPTRIAKLKLKEREQINQ